MSDELQQNLDRWKHELEKAWLHIPKPFRSERAVHRTLQCHLFRIIQELGLRTVADYMPPRIVDRPIDIIAVGGENEILYALCLDTLVTLPAVKSLNSFAAANKVIFTTGMLEKKVNESRFFLNEEIRHVHLKPFEK
ncbi:MAG: hypothetical protein LLG06_00265 [Desulfobacteraceae bacterium]|nr:hypothetical protein [Desulfobacteraceae bacterium]